MANKSNNKVLILTIKTRLMFIYGRTRIRRTPPGSEKKYVLSVSTYSNRVDNTLESI